MSPCICLGRPSWQLWLGVYGFSLSVLLLSVCLYCFSMSVTVCMILPSLLLLCVFHRLYVLCASLPLSPSVPCYMSPCICLGRPSWQLWLGVYGFSLSYFSLSV